MRGEKATQTFTVELDNMDRMLIQTELTVIAGDHESYNISVDNMQQNISCRREM